MSIRIVEVNKSTDIAKPTDVEKPTNDKIEQHEVVIKLKSAIAALNKVIIDIEHEINSWKTEKSVSVLLSGGTWLCYGKIAEGTYCLYVHHNRLTPAVKQPILAASLRLRVIAIEKMPELVELLKENNI